MALLNYTTTIEATKTVSEIQGNLARHGAKAVLTNYDDYGQVESLSFQIQTPYGMIGIRLPVNPEAILKVLQKQNAQGQIPRKYVHRSQAIRVAWRIIKDWVEAQMALLETEMVKLEQIFLPYVVNKDGRMLYDTMVDNKFLLPLGNKQQ